MKPEDALKEKIARYRLMSGEQRLAVALELHELARELAMAGIRHQFPDADEAEVSLRLRKRLELARNT